MALRKKVEVNNSGVEIDYWRVTHAQVDFTTPDGGTLVVMVHGWLSENARRAGKGPLANLEVRKTATELGSLDDLARTELYALVKARDDFQGSEDA